MWKTLEGPDWPDSDESRLVVKIASGEVSVVDDDDEYVMWKNVVAFVAVQDLSDGYDALRAENTKLRSALRRYRKWMSTAQYVLIDDHKQTPRLEREARDLSRYVALLTKEGE